MKSNKRNLADDIANHLKFFDDFYNIDIPKKENDFDKHKKIYESSSEDFLFNTEIKILPAGEPDIVAEKKVHVKKSQNIKLSLITEEWMESSTLSELDNRINKCIKCSLHKTRTNFVFGTGNPEADVVIVGEAPGADEDLQGLPFVGRAGQLLTDILKAINFKREEVYICNILKCRPPENRNPLPEEIFHCEPYLIKQLELIKPSLILAAGTFAAQTLLKVKEPLGKLRGRFFDYSFGEYEAKVLVTYHPAALLRNPNWKRPAWEDVKLFRKEYDKIKKNI